METRICNKCELEKPLDMFSRYSAKTETRRRYCKSCGSAANKLNKQVADSATRAKRLAKQIEHNRNHKMNNPVGYARNRKRAKWREQGIDPDVAARLLAENDGKCEICKVDLIQPVVDHCHNSQKVRGILCNPCNLLLGFAKDSPEILNSAIAYLNRG